MTIHRSLSLVAAIALFATAIADDGLLGKPRGGKGGGNSGGQSLGGGGNSDSKSGERNPPPRTRDSDNRDNGSRRTGNSGGDDSLIGRRSGRSGVIQYGTNSNSAARGRNNDRDGDSRQPSTYRFPTDDEIAQRANREARTRPNTRRGYYHYDSNWRDDNFSYPYYRFDYDDRCVFSPWYAYPHLPGYVSGIRISINLPHWSFTYDDRECDWRYQDRYDRYDSNYELDVAVRDLVRTFERRDMRALDSMLPRRSRIAIRNENGRAYSINSDDFYDLMNDAVNGTRTRRYAIESVREGRGGAQIVARHEFDDPWGRRDAVYHQYILEEDYRGGYSIVEFGTHRTNPCR